MSLANSSTSVSLINGSTHSARPGWPGVRRAATRRGLADPLAAASSTDVDSALAVLRALPRDELYGVAAYNDHVALAVLSAAARLEVVVPDRPAVAGADATDVGRLWIPALTSVAVNMSAVVDDVVSQLREALDLGRPQQRSTTADILRLVPGGST